MKQKLSEQERFWNKVEFIPFHSCWEWNAGKDKDGYGQFSSYISYKKRKPYRSNRFVWELLFGPIPAGMLICHICDNPSCVRPDHLFLGTPSDNLKDAYRKGRLTEVLKKACLPRLNKTHCPTGHEYDLLNTRIYNGKRYCRACEKTRLAKQYQDKKLLKRS